MAKYEKYDDEDGVWRTVGGRRIFIRNGQALSDAMKESGKFKNKKTGADIPSREEYKKAKIELKKQEDDEYALYKKARENEDSIDAMTENSTDWEALEERYKDRYETEQWDKESKKIKKEREKKELIEKGLSEDEIKKGYKDLDSALKDKKEKTNYQKAEERYNKALQDFEDGKISASKLYDEAGDLREEVAKKSSQKAATKIVNGKAVRDENAQVERYNKFDKNEEQKRIEISKEIAKELNPSLKNASENLLEKRAGEIRSYADGEVLEKNEKPYTNIYGGVERSTSSLENWLKELKKSSSNTSNDWLRNAFNEYKKEHPNTKMKFEDFIKGKK